jgi:hypothetical protein
MHAPWKLALVALTLCVAGTATSAAYAAGGSCLTGESAGMGATGAGDAAEVATVRTLLEEACPCSEFDGTSESTDRKAYKKCAKHVVKDAIASDLLRKKCKKTLKKSYKASTCGHARAARTPAGVQPQSIQRSHLDRSGSRRSYGASRSRRRNPYRR